MRPAQGSIRRRLLSATAVVVAAALVVACGVREDDSPRVLADDVVPAELTEPTPSSTDPQVPTTPQRIFVVQTTEGGTEEVLSGVYFNLPISTNSEDYARQVIEQLVNLRPPEDATFTTAIPPTTGVLDVRRITGPDGKDDILEINLNQLQAQGRGLKLAIAQIVFTATSISGVRGVRFLLNGVPVAVPLDDGESQVGAVVTKADFPQTNPTPPTTTSTTVAAEPAEPVPAEVPPEEPGP